MFVLGKFHFVDRQGSKQWRKKRINVLSIWKQASKQEDVLFPFSNDENVKSRQHACFLISYVSFLHSLTKIKVLRPNISQINKFSKNSNWAKVQTYQLYFGFLVQRLLVRACVRNLKMWLLSELWPSKFWDASITQNIKIRGCQT